MLLSSAAQVSLMTVLCVLSKKLRISCSPPTQRQLCHSQGKGEVLGPSKFHYHEHSTYRTQQKCPRPSSKLELGA